MIDSSKLLSRTTSKRQSLLSRESVTNLIIIKRDTIKIDGLLKERLVLSKVREGILKRRMENEMRRERERNLEARRETDDESVSPESNKKPKSILGTIIKFLFGGFLKLFSGLFIRILPRLPFLIKTIAGFSRFFLRTLSGSFRLIGTLVARGAPLALNALKGVSKTLFTELAILIKKGTVPLVLRAANFLRGLGIGASLLGTRRAITGGDTTSKVKRTEAAIEDPATKIKIGGRDITKKYEKLTDIELEEELLKRRELARRPLQMAESPFGTTDVIQQQKREIIKREQRDISKKFFKKQSDNLKKDKIAEEKLLKKLLSKKGKLDMGNIPDPTYMRDIDKAANLAQKNMDIESEQLRRLTSMSDVELREIGFDADEIRSNLGVKAGKDAGADALLDAINNPKNTVKASKLVGKKGLSKLLFNIGGEALEQSVKQSIKASIGVIPILGDLIGVLLDVFLFGEPVGRAVFKGIGSFALGALLAGVGTFLGGPIGTLLGSIIGGIGGDILGGIAYDLFFGRKPKAGGYSTVTGGGKEYLKGVSKAVNIQYYNEGGLVAKRSKSKKNSGIDPRILELYPELDPTKPSDYIKLKRKTLPLDLAIESQAFYEKSVGREIMVPIPIPIPNTNSQSQSGLSITVNTESQKRNTFSQLYRRG
jgi:actin-related protein